MSSLSDSETSSTGATEYRPFRHISRDRLLYEMLKSAKSPDSKAWKVLIMDKVTVKVMSHSCKMADITDQEISLVEDLFRRRQPLPSLDAVYFMQPSKENVVMFLSDMSGREPLYKKAYVFFSSPIPKELVNHIKCDTSVLPRIGALREMNLEYFPIDSQGFITDQETAMEELYGNVENTRRFNTSLNTMSIRIATVFASLKELPCVWHRAAKDSDESTAAAVRELVPTKLANAVWDMVSKYKSTIPGFPQNETCDMLIVDRSIDQIAPVIHEWTYDAMCHDLLNMDGDKYMHEVPSKVGGQPEIKEVILQDHDSVWLELRHTHIADASERLHEKFTNFVSKNKAAQIQQSGRDGSELSTRDLQKMVQALPQYTEQVEKISLHVEIAGKINKIIRETDLRELGQLEQDLVFGDAGAKENTSPEYKLRLLMIYASVYPEKFEGDKASKLMQLAKLSPDDMKVISNMQLLAGSSNKKSSAAGGFSLKFSNQKTKQAARKDRTEEEETWQLFRFYPMLEELIENLIKGELPKNEYSCINEPSPSNARGSVRIRQQTQTAPTTAPHSMRSRRTANWGRARTSDDGYSSDSTLKNVTTDFKRMGKRIFVFIIGGATRSELRVCHKLTQKLKREVILGTTSMDDPPQYLTHSRMETWECSGDQIEFNSQSLGNGDSNALILPAKRVRKRKGKEQENGKVKSNKKQKLSKPQKRKMKKLEDDKEKQLLLEKAIKTLNENTLPEYAYPLLLSSCNINRDETMKEKRRRAVHLLKEGLEVSYDGLSKKPETDEIHLEHADEVEENEIQIQPIRSEEVLNTTSVSLESSQEPVHGNEVENYKYVSEHPADISIDKHLDEIRSSTMSCSTDEIKSTKWSNVPTVVHVYRPTEVEDKRKDLPIVMMEQEIMEAINDRSSVIICGETGCGKTTQVPQFLYEAGYGSSKGIIGVTQPRRVAVLATAKRVAYELGLHLGKEVGFQVRYDKKIGESCSIKFMTDGILLREVQNDILLRRYSVLILDEAHERSLNTDILIGMLSRVIKTRQMIYYEQKKMILSGESVSPEKMIFPLKLVLMSATLRVQDFTSGKLFHTTPPVIEVPTRQFPVTAYFAKKTEKTDYIGEAYKKVLAIHKRLPPGGILVFVTGQREVEDLCRKLRKASREFIKKKVEGSVETDSTVVHETNSVEGVNINEINEAFEVHGSSSIQQTDRFSGYDEDEDDVNWNESEFSYDSETDSELEFDEDDDNLELSENRSNIVDVLGQAGSLASLKAAFEKLSGQATLSSSNGEETSVNLEGNLDQSKVFREKRAKENCSTPGALCVLPLYAMLPAAAQLRVFEEVGDGERLVVVATNVAETSLTIPGIKYVVDTGREKVKNYDPSNGMETYEVQWISKASAAQRAGRSGRTGPGHCYRLYSSAAFSNEFPEHSPAEVEKVPVHGVVLLLKSMHIKKVANFPFPTSLKDSSLLEAENCLKALEALDNKDELTLLGKAMAHYPLSPRHSRMLLTVIKNTRHEHKCNPNMLLAYAVAAAAALSLSNPFVMQYEDDSSRDLEMVEKSSLGDGEKGIGKKEKSRKKKLKETAKVAREKFRVVTSDALTIAYALQCFEHSEKSAEFCDDNALHFKTMDEMSKLRQQLLKLVFYQSDKGGFEEEYSWIHGSLEDVERAWQASSEKYPLSLVEERLICQAICAGWADRVAKRITASSRASDGEKTSHALKYQSSMVDESVFLHRWSSASIVGPEFLVYNELLETKRPNKEGITSAKRAYMHGVTSVEPAWLVENAKSSCIFSPPLMDPRPYYDARTDQVKCWVIPTFGRFCWELPKHSLPISNDEHQVQVFAYALLEGQVCPCLKSVRKYMSAPPESIMKREAFGQKRVGNLLSKLKSRLIDSSAMLRMCLWRNKKALFIKVLKKRKENINHYEGKECIQALTKSVLNYPSFNQVSGGKGHLHHCIHPELPQHTNCRSMLNHIAELIYLHERCFRNSMLSVRPLWYALMEAVCIALWGKN
ncbi:ATP-dependent RNA helicase DEAH13 [Glycine soja]